VTVVGVRSAALVAASARLGSAAEELQEGAAGVAGAMARCPPPVLAGVEGLSTTRRWARVEVEASAVVGGLCREAVGLDALAGRLRAAAHGYEAVEEGVAAVVRSVAAGADLAARGGWLADGGAAAAVRAVPPAWSEGSFPGVADVVAAGRGLDGGRVRVVEVDAPDGGSAWVVVVPGTQEWGPRAGANPFDLTTDVRAVTGAATVAAAGVTAALARARSASRGRAAADDPVLLVGHSQGGILAAALASDPAFTAHARVTHVVTTGAPVGLFPVPEAVRVLSVEHVDDPVPRLDLSPNPARPTWLTVRAGDGLPVDVRRHALEQYVRTTRSAAGAPHGTVAGMDAWTLSAAAFLGRPVRSVTEVVVERGWQNPRP
jgi:hypothetical protein